MIEIHPIQFIWHFCVPSLELQQEMNKRQAVPSRRKQLLLGTGLFPSRALCTCCSFGVESSFCCLLTAYSAFSSQFKCHFISGTFFQSQMRQIPLIQALSESFFFLEFSKCVIIYWFVRFFVCFPPASFTRLSALQGQILCLLLPSVARVW